MRGTLTSAHVAKKSSPLAALLSGGKASDDFTMPSSTRRSASLAMDAEGVWIEPAEMPLHPVGGSGAIRMTVSLANSSSR